ncbi:phosphoribosylamine--glycine ligase [Sporobacter termitidis DSM 10068]|uniref:Phosphoribosylamine--glycine ligase n=1 Tax=Sporobacter termitidis DSM 10068 TaxID=1123282 RepID=A0A1M5X5T8_9FIRM|nr:phosphoribosylamine--glycine ligase [Sporobacter termitidis]SHH94928.1 phosphoribosylamine--glycine ligase [Sporobacter termitidis DSM 10068]
MNVLVVGGGGREHAICWALRKSPRVDKLYCAPGNGGIAQLAECVDIKATDIDGIAGFAKNNPVDFVMVAPDDPLALGLVDALEDNGIRAFGPRRNAAVIEASKVFSKSLMKKYGIPTAGYEVFTELQEAEAYIREKGAPIVVKADGLALGKGVVVAQDVETAIEAVRSMMLDKKFGDSGLSVVIEECMTGPEVTVLAFTDGRTIVPMLSSQDHKRALDNDEGPNTGGMGAFCPSPNYTPDIADACMKTIFLPTIDAMKKEGRTFKGVIYFGLMLTPKGPRVVEYNARFGDPETQPILSMLETDLLDIFEAVVDERLSDIDIKWRPGAACCIVMASGGYPGSYEKGCEISGLDAVPADITVFHAGTTLKNGTYYTSGGRVLGVTAVAGSLPAAVKHAYEGVGRISFKNAHYRTDIGRK